MEKRAVLKKLRTSGGHAGGHAHRRRHRLAVACRRRDPPPAGANFHQSHVLRGGAAGVFLHRRSHRRDAGSVRRAGRIMGVTVLTFVVTGILAAVLMFLLMKAFPPVLTPWQSLPTEAVGDYAAPGQLLVNFFTAEDFVGLLSRRAMLPLIVFSVLLGFAANLAGGPDGPVARGLTAVTQVMMQLIRLLTYYAPVAFFAIFAGLVAGLWPQDRRGLRPGHGGVLPPVLRVPLHRLSPDGPAGRRAGRHRRHAAAHRPPGPDVSGDLLIGGHHPRQSGGGGGHRHQPGRGGDGHSSGGHHAHGRLVLQLRAEDRLCLGRIRAGAHMGKAAAQSWRWRCCPLWGCPASPAAATSGSTSSAPSSSPGRWRWPSPFWWPSAIWWTPPPP